MLSREQLRTVYDRVGAWQDAQSFYEKGAVDALLRHGAFDRASSILEIGCGTGALARQLLADVCPGDTKYQAIELSPVMAALAQESVAPFSGRATIHVTGGAPPLDVPEGSVDRVVAAYVLDVLPRSDIITLLDEAHDVLQPGGRICFCGLSPGKTVLSRMLAKAWTGVHAVAPSAVGGCRPVAVEPLLDTSRWRTVHHETVTAWGIPSEVLVAMKP